MGRNQLDTDSFTGADFTNLSTYNAKWVAISGKNECYLHTNGCSGFDSANGNTGQTWTNDQYVQVTVKNLANVTKMLIGVRINTAATLEGYFGGITSDYDTTHYSLVRYAGGSPAANLAGTGAVAAANDVILIECIGTTINFYVNGSLNLTATDATLTTNNVGLHLNNSVNINIVDDWIAGSVTTTVLTSPLFRGS